MKALRALISLLLVAGLAVGGVLVYRACDKQAVKQSIVISRALQATAEKNPYEDPNDPNTDKNGTVFSTGTMTGYYMDIATAGVKDLLLGDYSDLQRTFKKKISEVTAIITFTDVKYNDAPVLVTSLVELELPRTFFNFTNFKATIRTDLTTDKGMSLRLPASYYNYLLYERDKCGVSLNNVKIAFVWNGNKTCSFREAHNCAVKLYTKDIPADSDDPNSPNFELNSWGGLMGVVNSSGCGCDSINWNMVRTIAIILGIAIAIGCVIKFFRWTFGTK